MKEKENKSVWFVDPVHTKIRFESKYLLITSVSGWFSEFEGIVTASDDFSESQIDITVYTNSVYTANEERDKHLRSTDFFDIKKFPILSFKSTFAIVKGSDVDIVGDLRIKNITKSISFSARYVGSVQDPMGNLKAGFETSLTLNRKDFNISWNQVFDKSGILLSDEVKIFCDIQLLKIY